MRSRVSKVSWLLLPPSVALLPRAPSCACCLHRPLCVTVEDSLVAAMFSQDPLFEAALSGLSVTLANGPRSAGLADRAMLDSCPPRQPRGACSGRGHLQWDHESSTMWRLRVCRMTIQWRLWLIVPLSLSLPSTLFLLSLCPLLTLTFRVVWSCFLVEYF